MRTAVFGVLAMLLWTLPAQAQAPEWDPKPWIEDLAQVRTVLETKYANLDWLKTEREVDLERAFSRTEAAVAAAGSDAEARAILDRLVSRIADGHVGIDWPRRAPTSAPASASTAAPPPPPTPESLCRAIGYDTPTSPGLAPALPGYSPLPSSQLLPAGTARVGGTRFGFLRISVFSPKGAPSLCTEAVAALKIPLDAPCGEECRDQIITHAYRGLGQSMMDRLAGLKAAGAQVLVVDITGNGGGSEWAEAAARMLSRRPLQSARVSFVRGAHWASNWKRTADHLRSQRDRANGSERRQLDAYIAQAEAARAEAERNCGQGTSNCPRLASAGYATGLVGQAPAGAFAGKDWAAWVFNPAQHHYRDGAWDGPVVVLTDQDTASAAEQFAAVLKDNGAAVILGSRTFGAGCGHTWGGTPTKLANSGATLRVPDCVRHRADGSNEVRGILPDVVIPWRSNDGRAFRAGLLQAALPDAARRAQALHRNR